MKAEVLFDVRDLAVVVTGGASGIGFACAQVMAENGARVTVLDRDADALKAALETLATGDSEVHGEVVDVTDKPALQRAMAVVIQRHGRLDVVFANAGISGGPGFLTGEGRRQVDAAIENLPEDLWQRVIATNLTSVLNTIQVAVPQMKTQQAGRIIVTGSISASKPELHVGTAYVVSKAAVAQLVRQVALELAKYNVQVNAIAPGPVITNIAGGRLKTQAAQAMFAAACPMHRLGSPEDIQGAALFLASPASRFVTGTQIIVDGGVTLGSAD